MELNLNFFKGKFKIFTFRPTTALKKLSSYFTISTTLFFKSER